MFIVHQTEQFIEWLDGLRDVKAQVRIAARIRHIEAGSLGDWKPIAGGVSELRVDYGPGYRIYFTRRGRELIILLAGGDKSGQKRDIRRALQIASRLGELE